MKALTIIKAIGAGITALYNAVQCADSAAHGDNGNAYEWSRQFKLASDEFRASARDLAPEAERGPRKLRKVPRATDLNYGGDGS